MNTRMQTGGGHAAAYVLCGAGRIPGAMEHREHMDRNNVSTSWGGHTELETQRRMRAAVCCHDVVVGVRRRCACACAAWVRRGCGVTTRRGREWWAACQQARPTPLMPTHPVCWP